MSIIIEKATIADLDALFKIEKECFILEAFSKRQIATLLQNSNSLSLLARIDSEIVGFVIALIYRRENEKVGHIYTLDVTPKARNKKVGSKLLEEAERILRQKGVRVCFLEVRADNMPARELYQKSGYIEIGKLENFYYPGGHGVKLKKTL